MSKPLNFLVGTDWWTDCDDAVAMRILAKKQKEKEINILGIGIDARMEYSVVSLDAFLCSEGLPDIPLGIDLSATDFGGNPTYQKRLASLKSKYNSNSDAEEAVKMYRRLLGKLDGKTDIIEIGYPQILSGLLKSEPDEYSDFSGCELVKQKVGKLWMMAGKWDKDGERENNFCRNRRASSAAAYVCDNWPTEITFLGFETGVDVITGKSLDKDDILYNVLCDHGSPTGRCSWDPMLVLMACMHNEEKAGYYCVKGKASVDADTGKNYFTENPCGSFCYVKKKYENTFYAKQIEKIISSNYISGSLSIVGVNPKNII